MSLQQIGRAVILTILLVSIGLIKTDVGHAQTVKEILRGKRLILEGAQCAGWKFKTDSTVLRFDELQCSHNGQPTFQARMKWIEKDQFILVESTEEEKKPDRPPRVYLYKVTAIKKSKVELKETWLGWGDFKDSKETYSITEK